jgi:MFS family permease
MEESGSTRVESGSRKPLDSGGLREIVERATHPGEETHEPRPRRYRPSRVLRVLIGLALFAGGLSGFGYGLVHLMHAGTCGSGPTPYVIGRQCPSGTGWYFALLFGSVFAALIGAALAGLGMALPMGIGFTAIGATALYGGLTAPGSAQGAAVAGYTVGPIFIVMGLLYLAFAIWSWRGSRSDTEPMISVAGLSQLIAATAPKPLSGGELSKDEENTKKGG